MSRVAQIIDQVLRDEGEVMGRVTLAWVQRKASSRLLLDAANRLRSCAALLDQAAALLQSPGKPS